MLRLMLMRHAKADWPKDVADRDRPLAPRGEEAAPRMGAYMARENLLPDLTLCSPATRTRQTWELARNALITAFPQDNFATTIEARIYQASTEDLLYVIHNDHKARTLLLVGHNPGLEELANALVGHGDRYAYARLTQKYPTCALAVIDFNVMDWAEITPRSGRLDRFITPRSLEGQAESED